MFLLALLGCHERFDEEATDRELAQTRSKIEADAKETTKDPSVEHPASVTSPAGPAQVAPEAPADVSLTPAELAAARDLAAEFGKRARVLGRQGTVDKRQLTTKLAQRHEMTVEELDRIYAIALVQHSAELTSALNGH